MQESIIFDEIQSISIEVTTLFLHLPALILT